MSILDKLLNKCEQDGVLKEEEEDIIRFGIESLINLVICLGILLCIGWIFGSLLSGIFFFAFFLPLKISQIYSTKRSSNSGIRFL